MMTDEEMQEIVKTMSDVLDVIVEKLAPVVEQHAVTIQEGLRDIAKATNRQAAALEATNADRKVTSRGE